MLLAENFFSIPLGFAVLFLLPRFGRFGEIRGR